MAKKSAKQTEKKAVELKIEYIPLDKLHPYKNNARRHEQADLKTIEKSIAKFEMCDPIGIWSDKNIIVEGHGRYLALKKLGYTEAPCIRLDHLNDLERREYALAHNKTAEMSEWDDEMLLAELKRIKQEVDEMDTDFDMSDFGFDMSEFDLFDENDEDERETEEDEVPEVDEDHEPITKLGDVWKLGKHRLMCGDSTDRATVEKLMDGASVDMVLSDPPYGMYLDTDFSGAVGSLGRKNNTRGNKYEKVIGDNEDFKPELITTFFENLKCEEMFLFGADYYAEILPNKNDGSWLVWDKRKESQADAIGSEFELIWSKQKHKRRMLRHDWFGFLSSQNAKDAQNRVHPTQKPVSLLVDIIQQWGKESRNIVDLYGGSGSTLIACEQLGRTCYMMELSPKYCDVIIQRWENLTGKKAKLVKK